MDGKMKQKGNTNDISSKGQSNKIEPLNNPSPMSGVKEGRNTGKIRQGTDFLRRNQHGSNVNKG